MPLNLLETAILLGVWQLLLVKTFIQKQMSQLLLNGPRKSSKSSNLFSLPLEIRIMIYQLLLPTANPFKVYRRRPIPMHEDGILDLRGSISNCKEWLFLYEALFANEIFELKDFEFEMMKCKAAITSKLMFAFGDNLQYSEVVHNRSILQVNRQIRWEATPIFYSCQVQVYGDSRSPDEEKANFLKSLDQYARNFVTVLAVFSNSIVPPVRPQFKPNMSISAIVTPEHADEIAVKFKEVMTPYTGRQDSNGFPWEVLGLDEQVKQVPLWWSSQRM
ncbi:MAG: hypothetical protein Q9227_004934 [Pyrenula ochraceoflavens]